jgi:hypothetical protein
MLRLHLKPFLERHRISAYQLARATKGKLSESTVYSLSREPQRRVDLNSVGVVIEALEEMTGEDVTLLDLVSNVEESPAVTNVNPKYAHLFKDAKPATKKQLERVWSKWTPEERAEDDAYWAERAEEKERVRKIMEQRPRDEEF